MILSEKRLFQWIMRRYMGFDMINFFLSLISEGFTRSEALTPNRGITDVLSIVSMLFIDLYGIIHLTFFFEKYGNQYKDAGKPIVVVVILLIILIFYIRYQKRYKELKIRWANETKNQRAARGFLVILAILLPILLPVLYLSIFR